MKRNIVRTMFFIAMLFVSLAAVAKENRDRDDCTCSNADLAGTWGSTLTGTQILPTIPPSPVPFAAVSRTTYDFAGNFSGMQTRSSNGTVSHVTFQGTYTLNSDCTGTKTVRSYDQSGNLLNAATLDFVLVNDGKEIIEVFTSVTLPNNMNIPVVITGHAQKLFSDSENEHYEYCRH